MNSVRLSKELREFANEVGNRRHAEGERLGLDGSNNMQNAAEIRPGYHRLGARCEAAAYVYFDRLIKWNYDYTFEKGKSGDPDLGSFIEVKGITKANHNILVLPWAHRPDHAYLLVHEDKFDYHFLGWTWGHNIVETWEPQPGRPCYIYKQEYGLNNPMGLIDLAGERGDIADWQSFKEARAKALGLVLPHFPDAKVVSIRNAQVQNAPREQREALGANTPASKLPSWLRSA